MRKQLKTLCLTLVGATLVLNAQSAQGGFVDVTQAIANVQGGGTVQATAAHGIFTGNNVGSGDLLTLLNSGTSLPLPDGTTVEIQNSLGNLVDIIISGTGMFSTSATADPALDGDLVDLIDGTPVVLADGDDWSLLGTTNAGQTTGPFSSVPNTTSGTVVLDAPVSGNLVVAFKAGNFYAVYAFEDVENVVSFTFDIFSVVGGGGNEQTPALSHVSLYLAPVNDGPDDDDITAPEPASMALFGLGALGMGLIARRRRSTNEAAV